MTIDALKLMVVQIETIEKAIISCESRKRARELARKRELLCMGIGNGICIVSNETGVPYKEVHKMVWEW